MIYIKYMVPAGEVSIWAYFIISIAVSLVVDIPTSMVFGNIRDLKDYGYLEEEVLKCFENAKKGDADCVCPESE